MNVKQIIIETVIHFPECGGESQAGADEEAIFRRAVGRIVIAGVSSHDVRDDAELAGAEGIIHFLPEIAAEDVVVGQAGRSQRRNSRRLAGAETKIRQRKIALLKLQS